MLISKYRSCPYDVQYQNLCTSWNYTKQKLEIINADLENKINNPGIAVMAAGSYGRYEAGPPSDLDYYIISMPDANATDDIMSIVSSGATELGIELPSEDGVFSVKIPYDNILNKLGNKEETIAELAQRLLPLIESAPIYNFGLCAEITGNILEKYMDLHRDSPEKEAVILLNDLIRFFRYICANYQYKSWHDGSKWVLRNIKLRHSRVIMYAGLLFVILNASKKEYYLEKEKYIKSMLNYTPIERISKIMEENGHSAHTLLYNYDYFLGMINQESIRNKLFNLDYSERHNHSIFGKLKRNSVFLQEELTNFVLSMRGVWSNKAIGYLIF